MNSAEFENTVEMENTLDRAKLLEACENASVQRLPKFVHTCKTTGTGVGLGLASARLMRRPAPTEDSLKVQSEVSSVNKISTEPSAVKEVVVDVPAAQEVKPVAIAAAQNESQAQASQADVAPISEVAQQADVLAESQPAQAEAKTEEGSVPAAGAQMQLQYGEVHYDDVQQLSEIAEDTNTGSAKSDAKDSVATKQESTLKTAVAEASTDESNEEGASETQAKSDDDASEDEVENKFFELGLPKSMCNQLTKLGYIEPTPIQAATIPHLLQRRDVLGQAQTGTGKTAAFALPLLANIDLKRRKPQVLVLCPTRELAMQVAESFEGYSRQDRKINVAAIYGGQSYQPQIRALKSGVQIVVGTPGRVMDHMKQGTLKIDEIQCLVLDEADEMLRMGFVEDVEYVLSHTPENRQIALFSATMPPTIREIAERYLTDPEVVKIKSKQSTADTVSQRYMVVPHHQKFETLARLLEVEDTDGVIIFTKTKVTTVEVADALNRRGMSASALNGDIAQSQRERTVQQLKSRRLDVLVATDVAARGLDIDRVSHVINYDMPHDSEAYVHRIGRTGRAGREGNAILLVTPKETRAFQFLQRKVGKAMQESELPSVDQLNKHRVAEFQKQIETSQQHDDFSYFEKMLTEWTEATGKDMVQVAASLAVMAQGEQPLLLKELGRGRIKAKKAAGSARGGFQCYRVAVGRRDRIQPKNIVGAIANESGLAGNEIGRIKIFESYALVELPEGIEEEVLGALSSTKVGGRDMKIRLTDASEMDVADRGGRRSGRPNRGGNGGGGGWSGGRGNKGRSGGNRKFAGGGGRGKSGKGRPQRG